MIAPDARVLVITVARIGDTLLATPLLRALKQATPRGRLEVMTHPKRQDVLRHLPFIDRLSAISKGTAWLRGLLEGKRFDWAFVLGHDLPLLKYALGVSEKVVAFRCADHGIDSRLHDAVDEPDPTPHAVPHRLLLLRSTGVLATDLRLAWKVTDAESDAARAWLKKHVGNTTGKSAANPVIGLQMASFHTKSHRDWPVERFIELAQKIIAAWPNARFVLLGDTQSLASAQRFHDALPERSIVAAGRLALRESAALVAQLDLYVGVDTGPTHIAGALGIPMVALYHPAYPGRNLAPLQNPRCRVIEHPGTGSHAGIEANMADIPAEQVWQSAHALLQDVRAGDGQS
jgi:heptosyltransferase-3